jgi:biotin carboxylase
MVDCDLVESAVSFSENPQQVHRPLLLEPNPPAFTEIFSTAIGGIILRPSSSSERSFALVDDELNNRLAFPWLLNASRPQKTLVIVEGGRSSPEHGGTATSIYAAARAMDINMVVLDMPGHWLEGTEYAHWRKDFLPVQLEPPSRLTERILDALRKAGYQHVIDGIVTFCDAYQVPVSRAAQQLGLPTAPPEAYEIATNKYRTSILDGRPAYRAHSVEEALEIAGNIELEYPLIVKPCNGWLSEGVFKVDTFSELATAINAIDSNRHGKEFVLEKYCDGPEVDFNVVLSDGEIVFYEVSDDFPKTADTDTNTNTNTDAEPQSQTNKTSFIELANVMPSKLPETELDILRKSLHQSLTRLGLTTGIFHLEARVHHSTMEYTASRINGIVDLYPRSTSAAAAAAAAEPPSAWLIEINPRPPGIQETAAVEATYGIDYWGISLVAALRDHERLRMLAQPFRQGAQYWCEMVFVPVTNGGIFDSDDVCVELMQRRPDLAAHISTSFCFLKRGDKVTAFEEAGVTLWVAYFVVFSRASREHLLELTATVRRETRFKIV